MPSLETVAQAAQAAKEAQAALIAETQAAHAAGIPTAAIARAAQISRGTAHAWISKK